MNRRLFAAAGLSCLALMLNLAPARALRIAPQPVILRVINADVVVVGKVTGFGPRLVPAERFAGDTMGYQIATVKVDETLGKGVKEVKVGFFPPMDAPAGGPGRPIRPIRRFPQTNLSLGQEACLLLVKHPTKDFYLINNFDGVINKKDNPNFASERAEIVRAGKLLASPKAGLKSKDAEERLTTAALLINRYSTPRGTVNPMAKKEAIDAEESKLILQTLADAEWKADARNWAMQPRGLFFRLNLQPADGWVQPKDFRNLDTEAKKWLKTNAGKYRIQRFVPGAAPAPKAGVGAPVRRPSIRLLPVDR
jgi:hypothetical protein